MKNQTSEKPSLHGIKNVLLQARDNPNYKMGNSAALDHLLVHVVYAIEAFEAEILIQEQKRANLARQVAGYLSDGL